MDNLKFWDRIAKGSLAKGNEKTDTIELLRDYLHKDMVVMDYGCGAGQLSCILAEEVEEVLAVDISKGMVEATKDRVKKKGSKNIRVFNGDIFNKSLKQGSFDIILVFNVFHFIFDTAKYMERINELLVDDGLFISSTLCLKEKYNFLRVVVGVATRLSLVPKMNYYTRQSLRGYIEGSGFEVIKDKKISDSVEDYFFVARKNR